MARKLVRCRRCTNGQIIEGVCLQCGYEAVDTHTQEIIRKGYTPNHVPRMPKFEGKIDLDQNSQ